jgi:transcriptional regulator with XRE-family HTH domain
MIGKPLSETDQRRIFEISTFLRELRVNSGYTQEQVSNETKLSRNSISKIENQGFFRIQHLFLLADFYEISLNDLFMEIK